MKINPLKLLKFTIIHMDAKNRMFRPIAIGLNDGRVFFRIDLWWKGLRITGS